MTDSSHDYNVESTDGASTFVDTTRRAAGSAQSARRER
jgi:hypothetical protein